MKRKLYVSLIVLVTVVATVLAFVLLLISPVNDTIVVRPLFTNSAYQRMGFYNYYCSTQSNLNNSAWCKEKYPDTCFEQCRNVSVLDIKDQTTIQKYSANKNGWSVLQSLGFKNFITDIDVANNPDILKQYKRVIILHNEYVTQGEYAAIVSHPNVVYLYPNSLYAEVTYDKNNNQITLVKGHNYITETGFDWKWSKGNSFESDVDCGYPVFRQVDNGKQVTCYPENAILYRPDIWLMLKLT